MIRLFIWFIHVLQIFVLIWKSLLKKLWGQPGSGKINPDFKKVIFQWWSKFLSQKAKTGLQIRASHPVFKSGLQIRASNPGFKSGLHIRSSHAVSKSGLQIRSLNPVFKSGLQIRSSNPVFKSGLQIRSSNPGFKFGLQTITYYDLVSTAMTYYAML
jgi:hypothetical protein